MEKTRGQGPVFLLKVSPSFSQTTSTGLVAVDETELCDASREKIEEDEEEAEEASEDGYGCECAWDTFGPELARCKPKTAMPDMSETEEGFMAKDRPKTQPPPSRDRFSLHKQKANFYPPPVVKQAERN